VVNGKRVKTVDIHAHCIVPEAAAAEGMRHLIAETGVGQVVVGTDYPFPWNRVPVDHIMSIPGLSDDDRIAILGGTAAKLLGIEV
jgi:aminocarboxymuconate-semialdehyde decarboxylase